MKPLAERSVTTFRPNEIEFEPYSAPMDYIRRPFQVSHPIVAIRGRQIGNPDVVEGQRRMLPDREGFWSGVYVVGPGGGEAWHTHLTYYDVVYYVVSGEVTVSWRDRDSEESAVLTPGSMFYIAPGATHRWLNTGSEDLRVVTMIHYHDFDKAEGGSAHA